MVVKINARILFVARPTALMIMMMEMKYSTMHTRFIRNSSSYQQSISFSINAFLPLDFLFRARQQPAVFQLENV